jgi:hypothetical protein
MEEVEQSMHPRSLRKVGQQLDMRKKWDNGCIRRSCRPNWKLEK